MGKEIEREFIAGNEQAGQRLDVALAVVFPALGLRGRRRLWNEYLVLVDGIARPPAFRLRGGAAVCLVPMRPADTRDDVFSAFSGDLPRLLARRGDLFFLYKPGGLHTEALAGSSNNSLAGLLERITTPDTPAMRLLTRLDQCSSGVIVAAGNEDAARHWRQQENTGGIKKHYLAVLEGRLDCELLLRNALESAKTRRTRVLDADGPVLRQTRIRPLAYFRTLDAPELGCGYPGDACFTIVLCCIAKGARHQIRAHAAHAGHPLAGDTLYGARNGASFFLHHSRIEWPGGDVSCLPPWYALLPAFLP